MSNEISKYNKIKIFQEHVFIKINYYYKISELFSYYGIFQNRISNIYTWYIFKYKLFEK